MARPILAQPQTNLTENMRLLIERRIADALAALWPSSLPMPPALAALQDAAVDLATLAGCDEQDRERTCKRLLRRYTNSPTNQPARQRASSLLHESNALIVPGVLAALTRDASDLQPEGMADAVNAWLAGVE